MDTDFQAEVVRSLKSEDRPKLEIQGAVAELKKRKKALEQREADLRPQEDKFDRSGLEDLLKRRFFYTQSFSIYGGEVLFEVLKLVIVILRTHICISQGGIYNVLV